MGYGKDQFGFRLWDPIAKKIVQSRDVVFNETKFLGLLSSPQEEFIEDFVPMYLFKNNTHLHLQPYPIVCTPTSILAPNSTLSSSCSMDGNHWQSKNLFEDTLNLPSHAVTLPSQQTEHINHPHTGLHNNEEEHWFQTPRF